MAKTDISDKIFAFVPITTQTILGSHVQGKANFMALGWLTRCNFKPPMIAIVVNKSNQSADGILDTGEFSINVPSTDMVGITDYTGLVSAKKTDRSKNVNSPNFQKVNNNYSNHSQLELSHSLRFSLDFSFFLTAATIYCTRVE